MFEDNESDNHLEDGLERMSLVARKPIEINESQQKTQSVNTALASDFMTDWHKIRNKWISIQCIVILLYVWCLAPLSGPLAPSHVVSLAFCLRLEVWVYDCSGVNTISSTTELVLAIFHTLKIAILNRDSS